MLDNDPRPNLAFAAIGILIMTVFLWGALSIF